MEKAYIILAHKNAAQVSRLINSLDDNQSTFFLHIDQKADVASFQSLYKDNPKVVAVPSVKTQWESFELVEATLQGLKTVAAHEKPFHFITLLSGKHYPIKSNDYINDFLSRFGHRIFLEYTSLPDYRRWKDRGGLYRIDKYFLGLQIHKKYTANALNFLSSYLPFIRRTFPKTMKPYAGSQWFTIDNYALHYILRFVHENKAYSAFHRHTFAPDELFFHNILLNAEDSMIRAGITNNNLLYMNWPDSNVGHPQMLTSADFDNILHSDALLARKFDLQYNTDIFSMIDDSRSCRVIAW